MKIRIFAGGHDRRGRAVRGLLVVAAAHERWVRPICFCLAKSPTKAAKTISTERSGKRCVLALLQSPYLNLVSDEKIRSVMREAGQRDGASLSEALSPAVCAKRERKRT